jgi:hypothetical protein
MNYCKLTTGREAVLEIWSEVRTTLRRSENVFTKPMWLPAGFRDGKGAQTSFSFFAYCSLLTLYGKSRRKLLLCFIPLVDDDTTVAK